MSTFYFFSDLTVKNPYSIKYNEDGDRETVTVNELHKYN